MRIELEASRFRVYLHWILLCLTISTGAWLTIYGGPNIARIWYPDHPIISMLENFSFLAWLLNIVQMALGEPENPRKGRNGDE